MTGEGRRISGQLRLVLFTLPLLLILFVLVVFLPPDGNERAEWAQFIGRFHPLAVHFPIALILLVPILELAGRNNRFSYLRLSIGFVLGLAALGATFAAILGWCLARSGGYSGTLLQQHMWGGIFLAAVCWLCWLSYARTGEREGVLGSGIIYATALATGIGLVAWTGYRGGQLSLGEDHLTEYMPAGLRHALRVSNVRSSLSNPGENTFYGARIDPIFSARCVTCHGPSKHKANLRLDSYRSVMRGGKDGPVIRAGNVQGSDLFRRITLPPGHDDFMPKENKRPLSPDQVKLIELWIGAGASDTLALNAIQGAPSGFASSPVPEVTFEEIDATSVVRLRAAIAPAVIQLQKQFPNILEYESRGSANLYLNASLLGPKFGDSDLAAFAPLAEHITVADFSRTAITDRSATAIAAMKQLRVLRFTNTGITDATMQQLGSLDQLESLNVFGTRVTPAALPAIAKLPKLAHFYVGQTQVPAGVSVPKDLAGKLVF
jgi:uncharacterized membrane protein